MHAHATESHRRGARVKHYREVEDPRLHYLKRFQVERLRNTYEDLAALPEYNAACFFFFNRLYSTEDTAERDAAFRNIYTSAKRFLGGDVAESMGRLIVLQEITEAMDLRMLEVLAELEAPLEFGMPLYEEAYRFCDNYQLRLQQIELLNFTCRLVHKISHRFGAGMVLRGLRTACMVLGDTRMVDFLMDGYRAFANLKRIDPLAEAIVDRETRRLDQIYEGSEALRRVENTQAAVSK